MAPVWPRLGMLWPSIIVLLWAMQAQTCTDDEGCNLNGLCISNGCVCDPGWRSADCGELDLQPAKRGSGYNFTSKGVSSWGSKIVHDPVDPSLFHLLLAEFVGGCGLDYWAPFSRIVRAESTTGPAGPYHFVGEVVSMFAHNPTVVYSPKEKLYLLYYIGCPIVQPASCMGVSFSCGRGNDLNGESGISVMSSPDLREWTHRGEIFSGGDDGTWDQTVTNPSAFVLESSNVDDDPSILLAYRGCPYNCGHPYGPEKISFAAASTHNGPYTRLETGPILNEPNEDPFIWCDKRGNYHLLLHSLEKNGGFGEGPNVGRHAYARSWNGKWTFNARTLAFNTTVHFTDGTTIEYLRRERPQLFFSEDGEMTPMYMTNGVQERDRKESYTVIVPIGTLPELYESKLYFEERTKDEL